MAFYLATNRLLLTELIIDKFFKRPNEYHVFNKTFFVKYTEQEISRRFVPRNDRKQWVIWVFARVLNRNFLKQVIFL